MSGLAVYQLHDQHPLAYGEISHLLFEHAEQLLLEVVDVALLLQPRKMVGRNHAVCLLNHPLRHERIGVSFAEIVYEPVVFPPFFTLLLGHLLEHAGRPDAVVIDCIPVFYGIFQPSSRLRWPALRIRPHGIRTP